MTGPLGVQHGKRDPEIRLAQAGKEKKKGPSTVKRPVDQQKEWAVSDDRKVGATPTLRNLAVKKSFTKSLKENASQHLLPVARGTGANQSKTFFQSGKERISTCVTKNKLLKGEQSLTIFHGVVTTFRRKRKNGGTVKMNVRLMGLLFAKAKKKNSFRVVEEGNRKKNSVCSEKGCRGGTQGSNNFWPTHKVCCKGNVGECMRGWWGEFPGKKGGSVGGARERPLGARARRETEVTEKGE